MLHDIMRETKKRDHLRIVRRLLRDGAIPVHLQDHIGASAMHYACASGHLDLIELLLAAPRGNYVLVDDSERTPLFWAAEHGSSEVVRALTYLSSSQVAPNPTDNAVAPRYFFSELDRLILVRYKDRRGWLPLHAAAAAGKSKTVEVLLERSDVDPRITDNEGRTPLYLAELNDHFDCCALLRTAVATKTRVLETSGVVQDGTPESSGFPVVGFLVVAISLLALVITS
jgi:ankyrin repeat protein